MEFPTFGLIFFHLSLFTLFIVLFIYGLPVELFNELRFDCDRAFFSFISLSYPPTMFVLVIFHLSVYLY